MALPPIKECEWNFTDLTKNTARILDACFWEYGRECKRLTQLMDELRSVLGELHQISDPMVIANAALTTARKTRGLAKETQVSTPINPKWRLASRVVECAEELNAMMGHLSWAMFCSNEFPTRPWFDGPSQCSIRQRNSIFFEARSDKPFDIFADELGYLKPKRVTADMEGFLRQNTPDAEVTDTDRRTGQSMNALEATMVEMASRLEWTNNSKLHCFIVPDALLDLVDHDKIKKFCDSEINAIYRRRVMPSDEGSESEIREHPVKWLEWLGVLRLEHHYHRKTIRDLVAKIDDRKGPLNYKRLLKKKKEMKEKKKKLSKEDTAEIEFQDKLARLRDDKLFPVYRKSAVGVFTKLFRVPQTETPRSFSPYDGEQNSRTIKRGIDGFLEGRGKKHR